MKNDPCVCSDSEHLPSGEKQWHIGSLWGKLRWLHWSLPRVELTKAQLYMESHTVMLPGEVFFIILLHFIAFTLLKLCSIYSWLHNINNNIKTYLPRSCSRSDIWTNMFWIISIVIYRNIIIVVITFRNILSFVAEKFKEIITPHLHQKLSPQLTSTESLVIPIYVALQLFLFPFYSFIWLVVHNLASKVIVAFGPSRFLKEKYFFQK